MLLYRKSRITLIVGLVVLIATAVAYLFMPIERLADQAIAFCFILLAEVYFFVGLATVANTPYRHSSLFRIVTTTLLVFYLIVAVVLNTTLPSILENNNLLLILVNVILLVIVSLCLYLFVRMRGRARVQRYMTSIVTERLNELSQRIDLLREVYNREEYFVQLADLKAAILNCDYTKQSDIDDVIEEKINQLSKSFALNKEREDIDLEIEEIKSLIRGRD